MFSSYFKVAWRNITRNKVYSLINIMGLALGMAGAILLLLNIRHGLSVDQFHEHKANLYTAYNRGTVNGQLVSWNATAPPLAPALQQEFPEIKNIARLMGSSRLLRYADKKINAQGNFVDPAFLSMFSFSLLQGNAATVLGDANGIVLTQQLATKLFGSDDPLNKTITTPTGDNFVVTGVLKDLPDNTRFKFEYLLSYGYLQTNGRNPGDWRHMNSNTFVELLPGTHIDAMNKKIAGIAARNSSLLSGQQIFLYPFNKEYLYGRFVNGKPDGGHIDNLRMLGALAGIILLIACINFMNLSTARSEKRAKEVGVRKVIGAGRKSLILQFIGESILMAVLAGIIAFILVEMAIPAFSALINTKLSIPWTSPGFWAMALGFVLLTGLLAGSYPAFYLSSFKPIRVLKGVLKNTNARNFTGAASSRFLLVRNFRWPSVTPRKILVVLQFVFSIFLINFTIIFQKQILYGLNRDTGFVKENLVFQPLTDDLQKSYTAVKNELINSGAASSVCTSNTTVTSYSAEESGLKWAGMDPKSNPAFVLMEEAGNFIRTNGLTLLAGRDIDLDRYAGDTLSCVVNEASVKVLGFKEPVGQVIIDEDKRWKIVGVVKDFLIGDPGEASKQVLIKGGRGKGYLSIRLSANQGTLQAAQQAEAILKKYNTNFLTEVRFADEAYAAKFKQTKNTGSLINIFAFLAIFVSCMGLLGLSVYMAENRTKEIGIRKVLGASVASITTLLARSFIQLILVAIVIASPLSWLFMNDFLLRFSYRTNLNAWVLVAAGAAAIGIALFTIAFQTIRAATANPVKSLRAD
ncbi:FtsX-like permease family protein [Pseudoflavitalea sp. X16]|uniref:ABC transporter permease n=1 Tax=Paraflavitalea devenefica TaxID=2716334 RepID=UPI00141DFADF|nr:ABC transporter permease [Paraflavitalea devenefica]NII29777.1 FtsX-like permease family protein [Paraflavitalea devenefica]